MSELRRPWYVVTRTGSVLWPSLEIAVGLVALVVQLLVALRGGSDDAQGVFAWIVAPLLVAQGVASLVWWSREDRRRRAREQGTAP
ncbi:hypothetical protein [Frigoribacterium salinisoli]